MLLRKDYQPIHLKLGIEIFFGKSVQSWEIMPVFFDVATAYLVLHGYPNFSREQYSDVLNISNPHKTIENIADCLKSVQISPHISLIGIMDKPNMQRTLVYVVDKQIRQSLNQIGWNIPENNMGLFYIPKNGLKIPACGSFPIKDEVPEEFKKAIRIAGYKDTEHGNSIYGLFWQQPKGHTVSNGGYIPKSAPTHGI